MLYAAIPELDVLHAVYGGLRAHERTAGLAHLNVRADRRARLSLRRAAGRQVQPQEAGHSLPAAHGGDWLVHLLPERLHRPRRELSRAGRHHDLHPLVGLPQARKGPGRAGGRGQGLRLLRDLLFRGQHHLLLRHPRRARQPAQLPLGAGHLRRNPHCRGRRHSNLRQGRGRARYEQRQLQAQHGRQGDTPPRDLAQRPHRHGHVHRPLHEHLSQPHAQRGLRPGRDCIHGLLHI